jgi:hypothetical protein
MWSLVGVYAGLVALEASEGFRSTRRMLRDMRRRIAWLFAPEWGRKR